jgi:hypothetical protein
MHSCAHTNARAFTDDTYARACINVHMHTCTHTHERDCTDETYACECIHARMHTRARTHIYTRTYAHASAHTHLCMCAHIRVHAHTHTYTQALTHTIRTHTFLLIHIQSNLCVRVQVASKCTNHINYYKKDGRTAPTGNEGRKEGGGVGQRKTADKKVSGGTGKETGKGGGKKTGKGTGKGKERSNAITHDVDTSEDENKGTLCVSIVCQLCVCCVSVVCLSCVYCVSIVCQLCTEI